MLIMNTEYVTFSDTSRKKGKILMTRGNFNVQNFVLILYYANEIARQCKVCKVERGSLTRFLMLIFFINQLFPVLLDMTFKIFFSFLLSLKMTPLCLWPCGVDQKISIIKNVGTSIVIIIIRQFYWQNVYFIACMNCAMVELNCKMTPWCL